MKLKKASIIGSIILFFLLIIIAMIIYNFIGPGAKDIKASKSFITKLYSINAISTEQDLKDIKYKRARVLNSKSELLHRTIVTQSYGIDLDKDNNVIGFAKKESTRNTTTMDIKTARNIAESYLKNICNGDVMLKTVKSDEETDKLPYYIFIYTKEKDGYPFYFDEIKVNINKETGFLDGYSNSTMQREAKEPVINYSQSQAEEVALNSFQKYNKDGKVIDETNLVYSENKTEENPTSVCEVCYIVTIEGKDLNNKDIKWKFLVSTENGNIINTIKDGVEKEVTTS